MSIPPPPSTDLDTRGFRGLPPFVDVVYGAVLGFGVFKMAEAIPLAQTRTKGGGAPLFLLLVSSTYLMFDYAQSRMCTEKYPYTNLIRYSIDMFVATAYIFVFVQAYHASPYYLVALSILLTLSAVW